MVKADGVRYRAYEVSDEGKLVLAKNVWLPTYNNLVIHTDATGLSDIIYYRKGQLGLVYGRKARQRLQESARRQMI